MRILKKLAGALEKGFSVLGIIWAVMEVAEKYFPNASWVKNYNGNILWAVLPGIVVAAIYFVKEIFPRLTYKINDKEIVIAPGNILWKRKGNCVIGVNNQWETQASALAKGSVHQQMVKKYGQETMDDIFRQAEADRSDRSFFYSTIKDRRYIFLRMSDIRPGGAANTTPMELETAIKDIFTHQEILDIENHCIYLPLLGTGGGGIRMNKQDVVKFILESFFECQKQAASSAADKIDKIHIVIGWRDVLKLDWAELNTWLALYADYCIGCPKASHTGG